jgi:acyl-CoA reductase-like NAD-dependent aldehyde dehydrogenase
MLRYTAGWPTKLTGDTIPISYPASFGGAFHSYTLREPVGVVGAITPLEPAAPRGGQEARTGAGGRLRHSD